VRPALLALLVATGVLYLAGLSRNGWANDFYAAAVQAGTKSWKAFLFGSLDSANFITVDKTPASLWVMELSGRLFGFSSWSMLVPQALEGAAAAGGLYATVRRWSGPAAGLIAGAIMAITPVATLMFRFNNPDALLVLLLVAAAYTTTRAVDSGRTRWVAATGALLGFGYLTKMLQAFLVLPAFALVYLIAGPPRLGRRIWQLLAGGAALIAAAGWWVAIDLLTPAADRPYVGGSTTNNILQLTFGYNGFGRLTGNEVGSFGFTKGGGGPFGGSAGLTRLFGSEMGGEISWLLPAALIALVAVLWLTRRAPRTDRIRAAALLWGGWLLVTGLVFSYMSGIIHPYYMIALAPAIAALTAIGAVALWRIRDRLAARVTMAAMLWVTAAWAWVLLGRAAGWYPWLRVVIVIAALAAAALILAMPALTGRRGAEHQPPALTASGRGRMLLPAAAISLAAIAGLASPLAYSLDTAATVHTGAIPSSGPSVVGSFGGPGGFPGAAGGKFPGANGKFPGANGKFPGAGSGQFRPPSGFPGGRGGFPGGGKGGFPGGGGFGGGLGGQTTVSSALTKLLTNGAASYTWTAATIGSTSAAPLELASGKPVMAIGGFSSTDPTPTLARFKQLAAEHKIHYFVGQNRASFGGSGNASQITAWVKAHFTAQTVGGVTVYDLSK
jgi:4-amino-4-deoxy-L-arabinose transferase-like glycosyltransferase